jgi:hypothetical protein
MKRIVVIVLSAVYMLTAIGFSLEMHLCGNKITSVHIENIGSDKCSCGMKMPGGCCKNIHAVFKISDNQKAASELKISNTDFSKQIFGLLNVFEFIDYAQVNNLESPNNHAPPDIGKRPVYLSNCVFRI